MEDETLTALKTQQEKYEQVLNMRNEEVTDLVDGIMKENCALKRQLVLNEIDIAKYQEMLSNACIKYYNLETGNMNDTDKTYFEAINQINIESEAKLRELNDKYEKTAKEIKEEHEAVISMIKSKSTSTSSPSETITLNALKDRVDSYETKMKTISEALFNAEKFSSILQTKYESLLQENKMIKTKIPQEKENMLFMLEELKKNNVDHIAKLHNEFVKQSDLITQQYISFSNNEKDKTSLIVDVLCSEGRKAISDAKELGDEVAQLKKENEKLKSMNAKYEEFIATKELEMSAINDIKKEYENNLLKSVDETTNAKKENSELKATISDMKAKIASLENRNKSIQETIAAEIENVSAKNKKVIDDLNEQLLLMEQKRRELSFSLELANKSNGDNIQKLKELKKSNELLAKANNEMKYKLNECEMNNKLLKDSYNEVQNNFKKIYTKYEEIDKKLINVDIMNEKEKKKFADNEAEIAKLRDNVAQLEKERNILQKDYDELYRNNMNLNQEHEAFKLNANFEISKLKSSINDYEKKLKSSSSNANVQSNEWNTIRSSIKAIYDIYITKIKNTNTQSISMPSSKSQSDELKMLIEMETNLSSYIDTMLSSSSDKMKPLLVAKDAEIASLKSKINAVIDVANASKAKPSMQTMAIASLESNNQLTQFYENLLIHIRTTSIKHMIEILSLTLQHEDEITKLLRNKSQGSIQQSINEISSTVTDLQTQLETLRNNVEDTFDDLDKRSTAYVVITDYERFVDDFKNALRTVTHSILNSFLEYKKEQNDNFIIFMLPINKYNAMLDNVMSFVSTVLEKHTEYISTIKSQGDNIAKAVDALYKLTGSDKSVEMIDKVIKEKLC